MLKRICSDPLNLIEVVAALTALVFKGGHEIGRQSRLCAA